jgi:hypothetical protein
VGNRPGHGHRRSVSADSSDDDEVAAQDREREAEEKRMERRRSEAKAAIEVRPHRPFLPHFIADRVTFSAWQCHQWPWSHHR